MKEIEKFDVDLTLYKNLANLKNEFVELILTNNTTLSGRIRVVNQKHVVIKDLHGKDYFDAFIPLNYITAVITRTHFQE